MEEERVGRKEGPTVRRREEGKGGHALLHLRSTRSVCCPDPLVNLRNLTVATEKRNFVVHGFHMANLSVHRVLRVQTIAQSFPSENTRLLSYHKRNHTSRKVSCLLSKKNQKNQTNTNWHLVPIKHLLKPGFKVVYPQIIKQTQNEGLQPYLSLTFRKLATQGPAPPNGNNQVGLGSIRTLQRVINFPVSQSPHHSWLWPKD